MNTNNLTVDAAHGGCDWSPRKITFNDEMGTLWSNCGANSECGKLKKVLLHRPGQELLHITQPHAVHWNAIPDLKIAQQQHDELAKIYTQHDVEVIYLEPEIARPNHLFMRDLFTMTSKGAVLSRMASSQRAGEELAVYQTLAKRQIPISLIVTQGSFEGPDLVFVDSNVAFVATSVRSNSTGANQVKQFLVQQGVEVVDIQTTYGCGHLDGVLSIIDKRKAVVYPTRFSYTAYMILKDLGYTVIDLPDSHEAETMMAINMVAIEPGLVLIPAGCVATIKRLKQYKIDVIPINVSELMKGGGAIHCMTGVIWRESI